jgi:hypothetical protein
MPKEMISLDEAYRLRFDYGLPLPVDRPYTYSTVLAIARRQQTMFAEIARLDKYLKRICLTKPSRAA